MIIHKFILLALISVLLSSCTKEAEKFTDEQKKYVLPEKYDKISQPGLIYVSHITNNFVSVFDPAAMKLIGQIPCGSGSIYCLISNDRSKGYIANYKSHDITIFDCKTNKSDAALLVGRNPFSLLELPQFNKLLISHESAESIDILDTKNNSITKTPELSTGHLYFIKKENKIYQPQIFTPFIYVIDPQSVKIIKQIKTGGRPMAMAFTNDERFGYLSNYDSAEVAKYDTKNDSLVSKIKNVPSPRGICASGNLLFVTNVSDNSLTVIDLPTDKVIKTLIGLSMPTSVVISNDGKYAVVSDQGGAKLSIIDIKSLEIIKNVDVAGNPIFLNADNR